MIKAVAFDFDGTLVDTEYYHWQGWVVALKPFGVKFTEKDYYNYSGKRGDIIEKELIERYKLKVSKGRLWARKNELLMEWFAKKRLKLMPHALMAIEFFKNNGLKVALCSGSRRPEVELKLKRTGLKFETVVAGSDVKRGKPYPDIYELVVRKLRVKASECIAFEDTQAGVESAKAAGLVCYAVPDRFSVRQDFSKADGIFLNLGKAIDHFREYRH